MAFAKFIDIQDKELKAFPVQNATLITEVEVLQPQNQNNLVLANQLDELQKTQLLQNNTGHEYFESVLDNLNNSAENVNQLTDKLATSVENWFYESLMVIGSFRLGELTFRKSITFVQGNWTLWLVAGFSGSLCGIFYYKILVSGNNPPIKNNPLANTIFFLLRWGCSSLAVCTFGVVICNILFNLAFRIPVLKKFGFLENGFPVSQFVTFIEKVPLARFGVVTATFYSFMISNQPVASTLLTAGFALSRYKNILNPALFLCDCVTYLCFATGYGIMFRFVWNSDELKPSLPFNKQLILVKEKLLYPLPSFLPPIPVFIKKKNS